MSKVKEKVYDWKNRLQDRHMLTLVVTLVAVIVALGIFAYKKQTEFRTASENSYNAAFYELVGYVENVENYLAKALISNTPEHGAETLTHVWREADLAQSYLARIPVQNEGLSNTAKFLNQVSEYSYSLSRKNIYNEALSQEELDQLKALHDYSVDLKNTLDQLSLEINEGTISWGELTKKGSVAFAQQVSNVSQDSFGNIEQNFHEYAGLIYDGAFSEHMTSKDRKGLTGEDISEEQAKQKVYEFLGEENIEEITGSGFAENGNIPSYYFSVKLKNSGKNDSISISISQKGGHVVYLNQNRNVEAEILTEQQADEIGKRYLEEKGFPNMKETYYLKESGIVTINYAYTQNDIIVYPDLIKLKIALDNGEILGMETTGYLNSHEERRSTTAKVSKEKAKETINPKLEISSEGLAIIPTEFQTEILCWEFKGKIDDTEFLVYINAETGREEDILVIVNTPNGTLTM